MAEQLIKNEMAQFAMKYRAVCEDDSYRGQWKSNIEQAYVDATNHRNKQGNSLHVIRIIVQQTMSMRFDHNN